jgi:acyl-CoA thioesterase FadM
VYVDWCDEAVSRAFAAAGIDPALLQPAAETVLYRRPVGPGMAVLITSRVVGVANGAVVMSHGIADESGNLYAEATTARR